VTSLKNETILPKIYDEAKVILETMEGKKIEIRLQGVTIVKDHESIVKVVGKLSEIIV
jgi:hypothetical protein